MDVETDYNAFKLAMLVVVEQLLEKSAMADPQGPAAFIAAVHSRGAAEIAGFKFNAESEGAAARYRETALVYLKGLTDMASHRTAPKQ